MPSPAKQRDVELDAWVVAQRAPRAVLDATLPYALFNEEECGPSGVAEPVATILLTNRECPWRCVMCDLWKNTLTQSLEPGIIPSQIEVALKQLQPARTIKLYNSGSFFDRRAIPLADHAAIAHQVHQFERVIVECHPSLVGDDCLTFRDQLHGQLEVAMGLETADPETLQKLNKGITLDRFQRAASFLRENAIDLRVFILVQPPYMREDDSLFWAQRSLDFAFDCGATAATLIPTRGGNGAMEALAARGEFVPPHLSMLEDSVRYGLALRRGRVFADLWDLSKAEECPHCFAQRVEALRKVNLHQRQLEKQGCARHRTTVCRTDGAAL
jgi:radical SAM enzyme (TIGR01210 family)